MSASVVIFICSDFSSKWRCKNMKEKPYLFSAYFALAGRKVTYLPRPVRQVGSTDSVPNQFT